MSTNLWCDNFLIIEVVKTILSMTWKLFWLSRLLKRFFKKYDLTKIMKLINISNEKQCCVCMVPAVLSMWKHCVCSGLWWETHPKPYILHTHKGRLFIFEWKYVSRIIDKWVDMFSLPFFTNLSFFQLMLISQWLNMFCSACVYSLVRTLLLSKRPARLNPAHENSVSIHWYQTFKSFPTTLCGAASSFENGIKECVTQDCFKILWAFRIDWNFKSKHTYPLLTLATYQPSQKKTKSVCMNEIKCVPACVWLCYVVLWFMYE